MLLAAIGIVFAANAGGAFSPIGDVTTIMLWLANKFAAKDIILFGILPSLGSVVVAGALLARKISREDVVEAEDDAPLAITPSEKTVIALVLVSFIFPIAVKAVNLPPVVGILLGLGLTWMAVDVFKTTNATETHLSATIEHLIQKADLGSIKFFIGILLAVSALGSLGILHSVSATVYGASPTDARIIAGNVGLGAVSSVLDNIPLTAIAIQMLRVTDAHLWVLLALMVGIGGSLLSLGSAAGVVAMGMVPGLTFEKYFKSGFVAAFAGFIACCAIWLLQRVVVG
jgi:Na+/H+ antiporter NhaD/arsenite permease-like protein